MTSVSRPNEISYSLDKFENCFLAMLTRACGVEMSDPIAVRRQ